MKKRIVLSLGALALTAAFAGIALAAAGDEEGAGNLMPVPGLEGVDETVVNEYPAPGFEDQDEAIVVNEYPAPGFEDIDEAIVESAG
ncbi:MAG TPA: hypothetical protein VJA44_07685 [Acidimicrobiia bacterium]|nr:hypothetical protein [Acidimicrobiia bacterium]